MGCCHPEKKIEENEIYSFFQKMEREQHFTFSIHNYEENYERIITLSSNKFKKLKKKQQVRIGFVNEILNNINKIYTDEKEDRVTRSILFNLLILTLTLESYLKEIKANSDININNNNDMQQFLLALVIKILRKKFLNLNNLKVVLYYIAKLLDLLFPLINDISQYYNIEEFINLINDITDGVEILHSIEIYPFIKVNLSCLGECFMANGTKIILSEFSVDILLNYYIHAFLFNRVYLLDNYKSLNKILFLYNNNNNINNAKTTDNNKNYITTNNNTNTNYNTNYNTNNNTNNNAFYSSNRNGNDKTNEKGSNNILKSFTTDFVFKTTTMMSTKKNNNNNNNNLNLSNYSINQSKIKTNLLKNSFVSNMEEFSFSYNNPSLVDIFKSKEFNDIKIITFSFYYFLNVSIQDTLAGKKLFQNFDDMIDTAINNLIDNNDNSNKITSKIDVNNNNNKTIFKIIYIILFNKCKLENNTIIILSFLYFIFEKIKKDKFKVQYYDLLSQIYFLFNNDNIEQLIINIFSQSFIKDIENKKSLDIVSEIFGTQQSLFHSNRIRIFKHFLINIGVNFKEIQGLNLKIKILKKLSDILIKYTKHFNKHDNEDSYGGLYLMNIHRNNKYNLKIDEFLSLFQNFELDEEIFFENTFNCYSYFLKYIKFFVNLSIFLVDNFTFFDLFKDFPIRNKGFDKLIYFITELEIFSMKDEDNCITDIIVLIEILIKVIKRNSINCLEDFHIITCHLGNSLKKIINDVNMGFTSQSFCFILKLSYSVIIFILIQLKKIFLFPNSIIKIHKTVIESVNKCNKKISEYLNGIRYEFYNENKLNIDIYQDFKSYLKEEKKFEIKYDLFIQVINIIYEKLFGNSSSLYLFFESQNLNLEIDEDISKSAEGKLTNMSQDHIDYINQIELKFTEDKDEYSLRKKNENEHINLPNIDGLDSSNKNNSNEKESATSENEYSEHLKV